MSGEGSKGSTRFIEMLSSPSGGQYENRDREKKITMTKKSSIVDIVAEACFANTFSYSRSAARIVIWTGMLLEVCVLYLLVYTSVDTFAGYPENQFLSTPWSMTMDTLIMCLVLPLTCLCFRSALFSVFGSGVLVSILVMNGWILCGDDMSMDSDSDILTRVNRVRGTFSLDDLTTEDTLFATIKYFLISVVMVIVPLWILCASVEYYMCKNSSTKKNLRVEYENEYVRELLHPVARGISIPTVKSISKRSVRLTWNMPRKGSKSTRSFRILQRVAARTNPDTYVESVLCHDTQVWSQVSTIPGLVSAIADRKMLKKIDVVRFFVAANLKPGKLYSWSVQPLSHDDSKRWGVASTFTHWFEVSKMKPTSFKEKIFGPPPDVLDVTTIIPKTFEEEEEEEKKESKTSYEEDIHDSKYSHLGMMDWLKSFMVSISLSWHNRIYIQNLRRLVL